jgi:hypothetical protein
LEKMVFSEVGGRIAFEDDGAGVFVAVLFR